MDSRPGDEMLLLAAAERDTSAFCTQRPSTRVVAALWAATVLAAITEAALSLVARGNLAHGDLASQLALAVSIAAYATLGALIVRRAGNAIGWIMLAAGVVQAFLTIASIYAVIGLKDTTTGDTLSDPNDQIVLESMTFPDPVIEVAIEPKTKSDQEKLSLSIQKLAEEDPTFKVHQDSETGQTVIGGMGELHLDILVDRMRREFKVEANVGKPQVAYKETIKRTVEKVEFTHKKQTGGSGQFAKVLISLEPFTSEDGATYEFESKVTGGRIPREYIPSVDAGAQDAMQYGVLAGYPLVNLKVTLLDGAFHEVDSSEMAFKIAGSQVLKKAAAQAQPVILEPIMAVEVTTPEDYMGDVIGDLNSRRGQIQAMEERAGARVVKAHVPLSEMFGYVGDLRSKTQGRANYSMVFDSYAEVPANVSKEIIAKATGQ